MDTLVLVPSLADDSWQDEKWADNVRLVNNLNVQFGNMVQVTIDINSWQRTCFVDIEELTNAGLELGGLYPGVFTMTPLPRPLGLLVETDDDVTFIPFHYPEEEDI